MLENYIQFSDTVLLILLCVAGFLIMIMPPYLHNSTGEDNTMSSDVEKLKTKNFHRKEGKRLATRRHATTLSSKIS
ncbi:MAG: hypothetical protein JW795_06715 [Chitinivibrionales bacterium]|nr:hypothetical protein [Chitinivibrionales bacterium]